MRIYAQKEKIVKARIEKKIKNKNDCTFKSITFSNNFNFKKKIEKDH